MRVTLRSPALALALVAAGSLGSARAASWSYTISVPDGRAATFELPFAVEHAGQVSIEASWTGPRLLFFGVEGPSRVVSARRSGPSPQRVELEADAASITRGTGWKLTIKALPARGEASDRLTITAPDPPDVVARREAELHPPPPPPPPPPAWTLAKGAPEGSSAETARVYQSIDAFRAAVLGANDVRVDACTWQIEFLEFAAGGRDRLGSQGEAPDAPSLRYFARLASVIRRVDALRTATNPVIAGPVPASRDDREDWLIARNEIVRPIERSLDELTELLRGGHAPALAGQAWLPRFTACLTACERYYDERVRLGGAENAPNGELATAQWDRILAASRIFEAWEPFLKEPRPPDP